MLPDLETPRLALRPLGLADLEDWLAMDLDPSVARFIWGAPPDPEAHREVLQGRFANAWPKLGGIWVVEERAAPGFLGWCGLFALETTGWIAIGYRFINRDHGRQNRGVARRRVALVYINGIRKVVTAAVAGRHLRRYRERVNRAVA